MIYLDPSALVKLVRAEAEKRQAAAILVEVDQVPMTFDLLDAANALPQPVRSSDAIHLASAMRLRDVLDTFVAYDKRLLAAADEVGLLTVAPGADG